MTRDYPVLDPAGAEVEIVHDDETYELPIKNFYAPIQLHWSCPSCGDRNTHDFTESPESYLQINETMNLHLTCERCDTQRGGTTAVVRVIPRVTFELAQPVAGEEDAAADDEHEHEQEEPAVNPLAEVERQIWAAAFAQTACVERANAAVDRFRTLNPDNIEVQRALSILT